MPDADKGLKLSHNDAHVLFGWPLKPLSLENLGVLYGNVTVADEPGFVGVTQLAKE